MTETTPGSDLAMPEQHTLSCSLNDVADHLIRLEAKVDKLQEGFDQVVATFAALGATLETDGLAGVMGLMMGGMRA